MLRVLLLIGSPRRRAEIAAMLANDASLRVAASAATLPRDRAAFDALAPDVVVLDSEAAARDLRDLFRSVVPILLLAGTHSDTSHTDVAGVALDGILPRNAPATTLAAAIHALGEGLAVFDPEMLDSEFPTRPDALTAARRSDRARSPNSGSIVEEPLTQRELEVLRLMADGAANKEIAARLGISEHTAKFHVASILSKLGAASRTEAVTVALRRGLLML